MYLFAAVTIPKVSALSVADARKVVIEKVLAGRHQLEVEPVRLNEAAGRVLAREVVADRDYPPVDRSIRDGFAVRSADVPGSLEVVGEVRAGECGEGTVGAGQAIEIMTGAPMPAGADAVVMVEHVSREGNRITTARGSEPWGFVNRRGSEVRAGGVVLAPGQLLGFRHIAMLATVGMVEVPVFRRPRVAVLATGDEVVDIAAKPQAHQVRNSNSYSVAAQVRRAGGEAVVLPVAPDEYGRTRDLMEQALVCDLLLLSGGVSAGKYDLVEQVLADLGADFYFTRVLIQPGQPLVFGRVRDRYFFGLPGNPGSTMVTFEVFARAAVELLAGQGSSQFPLAWARLTQPFRHKTGLTRFLPARLDAAGLEVTPVSWQGSSDVAALARANVLLVADAEQEAWNAGDMIPVLLT